MTDNRPFSSEELLAISTINCCANAVRDNIDRLWRRTDGNGLKDRLTAVSATLGEIVQTLVDMGGDDDQKAGIVRRMLRMKVTLGYVHHPLEEVVMLSVGDANTLLAPVLDRCDIECPCVTVDDATGERTVNRAAVKGCETRKALKRAGVAEVGLSMECPYSMMV